MEASDFPPGFEGHPLLFMAATFGHLIVVLFALEWGWRIIWQMCERPVAFRTPLTVIRLIILCLLVGALFSRAPDAIILMSWADIEPSSRERLQNIDAALDALGLIPFGLAWMLGYIGWPLMTYQLTREPLPVHLWPTRQQMVRPAKIGAGVFALAFALAYLR